MARPKLVARNDREHTENERMKECSEGEEWREWVVFKHEHERPQAIEHIRSAWTKCGREANKRTESTDTEYTERGCACRPLHWCHYLVVVTVHCGANGCRHTSQSFRNYAPTSHKTATGQTGDNEKARQECTSSIFSTSKVELFEYCYCWINKINFSYFLITKYQ